MTDFTDVLAANTSIPNAFEKKFPMLPKLSKRMRTFADKLPNGPQIPGVAVTVLEPPAPDKTGQPLAGFFNGPPLKGPALPGGGVVVTPGGAQTALPLSPRTPGAERGSVEFTKMPLSPGNPGAIRGTVHYSDSYGI